MAKPNLTVAHRLTVLRALATAGRLDSAGAARAIYGDDYYGATQHKRQGANALTYLVRHGFATKPAKGWAQIAPKGAAECAPEHFDVVEVSWRGETVLATTTKDGADKYRAECAGLLNIEIRPAA